MVDIRLIGLTHVLDFEEDDEVSLLIFESSAGGRLELPVDPVQAYEVMEFAQSKGGAKKDKEHIRGEVNNVPVSRGLSVPDAGESCAQI